MNSELENLEHLPKMKSNKPIILTRLIVTHISKALFYSAQADPIIFSILKERSDINFQHKNLDIYVNSSVLNGNSKERLHQSYSKNINNGSSRSSRLYDNIAKSADARKRRRSRESAGPDRRKPKFLK